MSNPRTAPWTAAPTRLVAGLGLSLGLAACGPAPDPDLADAVGEDEVASRSDVAEWSPEACAILGLANAATVELLDGPAHLERRAAQNIFAYRTGAGGDPSDDRTIGSIAELDAIPRVGRGTIERLLRYAVDNGYACAFPPLGLQVLNVSDWHGQLDPIAVSGTGNVGGAAVLAAYFARDRAANPNTLVLTAGDGFGATPPLASFFEERPAVLAMNAMGFDADGIGNHNFDRGVAHMEQMARLAEFPYLSANLANVEQNMTCPEKAGGACIEPFRIFDVGGVKVAVIGVTNPDAPWLTKPGNLGTIEVEHPVAGALRAKADAEAAGAEVFIAIVHMGAIGVSGGAPIGPLVDFATALSGFDLILGDHTNVEVMTRINGTLVLENRSNGLTYARTTILFDRHSRQVVDTSAELVTPRADAIAPSSTVEALMVPFRAELAAAFDDVIATTSGIFERGSNVERLREVALGDLVADALRARYGTELAFTNGGGLRASIPSSYAPANPALRRPAAGYATGLPYDVVTGDVFAVLPFGNSVVTRSVTGSMLWQMLEHSVEALPSANGWFGQISGFRFVFDSTKPAGSRVTSVTLDDGTPILADEVRYTMATSDFIAAGGDGYTMLADGDGTSREKMADVLLDHLRALGTLTPATDGRITDQPSP